MFGLAVLWALLTPFPVSLLGFLPWLMSERMSAVKLPFTFRWPILGQVVITSPYGERLDPVTHLQEKGGHDGIDLRCAEGTPLHAPGDGKIVKVWRDDLNGRAVKIQCGEFVFGFAHLSAVMCAEGDSIRAGEVFAASGGGSPGEGHSTGPHLHMTVRQGGPAAPRIDPERLNWVEV